MEQLVTFEVARLAKEKGFNETSEIIYREDGEVEYLAYYDSTGKNSLIDDGVWYTGREQFPPICTAPSQSILQKWLREEHSLYVLLEETETLSLKSGIGFYYKIIKVKDKEHLGLDYSNYFYKTYEDALEAGLKEGLRLIP